MLEELRSLSPENKKRVLIVSTIIIMIIVVGLWMLYFNSIVIGSEQQTVAQPVAASVPAPTPVAAPQASGPGLWQNMKNWFGGLADILEKPSQYKIQPN
jgi:hypothetical protein